MHKRIDIVKDHTKCVNYNKINVCVRCKWFYINEDKTLEDLYFEKEEKKEK